MPLPKTKDVGEIMKFLKKENPNISRKQLIAMALSQARKSKAYSNDAVKIAMKKIGA